MPGPLAPWVTRAHLEQVVFVGRPDPKAPMDLWENQEFVEALGHKDHQ